MTSGQRVLRRGILLGAGIKTPGGSCGNCASSASLLENSSLRVSSGILCDMLLAILLLSLSSCLECMAGKRSCQGILPSDRLNEVRTQSVAGRNKIEYYLSDRLNEVRTQYFLWSCLTDAVRRRAASSRTVRGTVTSKTHFKVRCRSE